MMKLLEAVNGWTKTLMEVHEAMGDDVEYVVERVKWVTDLEIVNVG